MKIRQNMLGNCSYVVVYKSVQGKQVRRFSPGAIAARGYGYGEMACAKFLCDNPKFVDGIKHDINKTTWSDDGEFDWLNVPKL